MGNLRSWGRQRRKNKISPTSPKKREIFVFFINALFHFHFTCCNFVIGCV